VLLPKTTKCPSCQETIVLADTIVQGALLRCKKCGFEFRLGQSEAAEALRFAERGGKALPREPRLDQMKPKREIPPWIFVLGGVGLAATIALVLLLTMVDTSPLKPEPVAKDYQPEGEPTGSRPDPGRIDPQGPDSQPAQPRTPPKPKPVILKREPLPTTGPWQQYSAGVVEEEIQIPPMPIRPPLDLPGQTFLAALEATKPRDFKYRLASSIGKFRWTLRSCVDRPGFSLEGPWLERPLVLPALGKDVKQIVLSEDSPWAAIAYAGSPGQEDWLEIRSLSDGEATARMALPEGWRIADVRGPDRVLLLDGADTGGLTIWSATDAANRLVRVPLPEAPEDQEDPPIHWARFCLGARAVVFLAGQRLLVYPVGANVVAWGLEGVQQVPALAPGGEVLALATDAGVYLVEISTARVVRCLRDRDLGPAWPVTSAPSNVRRRSAMTFSAGGEYLIRLRPDGLFQWWDFMRGLDGQTQPTGAATFGEIPHLAITRRGWVVLGDRLIHPRLGRTAWLYEMPDKRAWLPGPDGRCWYLADETRAVLCAVGLPLEPQREILAAWQEEPTPLSPGQAVMLWIDSPLEVGGIEALMRDKIRRAGLVEDQSAQVTLRVEVISRGSGQAVLKDAKPHERVPALRWLVRAVISQSDRILWQQPWKLVVDETTLAPSELPMGFDMRAKLDARAAAAIEDALSQMSLPSLVDAEGRGALARTQVLLGTTPPAGER
jgi:hypothetical protein